MPNTNTQSFRKIYIQEVFIQRLSIQTTFEHLPGESVKCLFPSCLYVDEVPRCLPVYYSIHIGSQEDERCVRAPNQHDIHQIFCHNISFLGNV